MSDVVIFLAIVAVLTAVGVVGGFAFGRRLFAWDDARARAAAAETQAGSAEPEAAPSDTLASEEHGGIDG